MALGSAAYAEEDDFFEDGNPFSALRGGTIGFFVSDIPGGGAIGIPGDPDFAEIQFLDLPRGRFLASAAAVLASSDTEFHPVDCRFTVDGVFVSELSRDQIGGSINNFLTLPLVIGVKLEQPGRLGVECRTDVADIVVSQPSALIAWRVQRLDNQNPS
jgi:hypothetical protein